ncbi:hypothetical protein HYSC106933_10020 [Hydrogenibacillus schlegelii]
MSRTEDWERDGVSQAGERGRESDGRAETEGARASGRAVCEC